MFVLAVTVFILVVTLRLLKFLLLKRAFDGSALLRVVANERLRDRIDSGRKTPSDDDVDDDNSHESTALNATPPLQQMQQQSQQPQQQPPTSSPSSSAVHGRRSTFGWLEEWFFGIDSGGGSGSGIVDVISGFGSGFGGSSLYRPTMPSHAEEFYNHFVGGDQRAQEARRQSLLPIVFSHQAELGVFPLNFIWSLPSPRCASVVKHLIDTYRLVDDERLFYCVDVALPSYALEGVLSSERVQRLASSSYVARIFHCWPLAYVPAYFLDSMLLKPQLVCAAAMTYATSLALNSGWAVCLASTPGCGAAIGDLESPLSSLRNIAQWYRLRNRATVGTNPRDDSGLCVIRPLHRSTLGAAPHLSAYPSVYLAWKHAQRYVRRCHSVLLVVLTCLFN
jgi:hypothetical protein